MTIVRGNVLGDVRAEHDSAMLDRAFYETPDYKTLLESPDRTIVVGRRGTGKSALAYRLRKHLTKADRTRVIHLSADEDQIIGLRPLIRLFGRDFRLVRAGARVAARYALLMEIANDLSSLYKFGKSEGADLLNRTLSKWNSSEYGFAVRLKNRLRELLGEGDPEENVSDLARRLEVKDIESAIENVLDSLNLNVTILIDRLDEGYEPDPIGVGLVDGVVHAVSDVNTKYGRIRPVVFLRDNIFRAVTTHDPDFSRGLEGQVLRLHWDEYALFNLVVGRLRIAFEIKQENATRVWNQCTAKELQRKEGFRKCLRLTLYRPRDVLILLNSAFTTAAREDRAKIIDEDIDKTAKEISTNRLNDLKKEYSVIFPGLRYFVETFGNQDPEMDVERSCAHIEEVFQRADTDPEVRQHMAILETPISVLRDLYSVGFIGVRDRQSGNYVFCHDGRDPTKEFSSDERIMVHPCYWMAINATRDVLDPEQAEEIYDEYDIEVSSETPEQRKRRIGQIVGELKELNEGKDDAAAFEDWCLRAVKVIFAGSLRNVELHPNVDAKQRRDIVATNLSETPAWQRIYEDYGVRQVVFEVKNYRGMHIEEYRQMVSYLTGEYGRLGFIITRDQDENLRKGSDLECMLEMYNRHNVLIVKITASLLENFLLKIRSPQKHDAPDKALNGILDRYTRVYIGGGSAKK